ncbi:MAG: SbcC/MukB-like Walker B domain-containing protein [Spirochaetia bacterium]|jgi:uncharacterized protein YPO0396
MNELVLGNGPDGFRLELVELYNWGTFGREVWRFPTERKNALVTGEIGSGKSTLVDAITTLLYPHHRITYNKAAGAERRERTIRGYILGEYKSTRDEETSHGKPVHIRQENTYSVILAVFQDSAAGRLVSIAHIYWLRAGEVQRIHVVSGRPLSILKDFSAFDGDGPGFKRQLKAEASTEVFESFTDYSSCFQTAMGITDKALDLFYQTVSMKSVGDLDSFIRYQMLESAPVEERIAELLKNYDNLRTAHGAVERTRFQKEVLLPIAAEGREHTEVTAAIENLRGAMDALPYFVLDIHIPLLDREIARLSGEITAAREDAQRMEERASTEREHEAALLSAIENTEAGRRIAEIERELKSLVSERDRRRDRMSSYREAAASLGYAEPADEEAFRANLQRSRTELASSEAARELQVSERDDIQAELRQHGQTAQGLRAELESLRSRTTSIPSANLRVRTVLLESLRLQEAEIPFVGELIRVTDAERRWEGAAERILRGFALSVLVPERVYQRVSDFVRKTDLRGRLVFYRVPKDSPTPPSPRRNSLLSVLEVKADTPFRAWISAELLRRFDMVRCDSMEEFFRETDAVTVEGLVKSGKVRHEKDDRSSVSDRRSYVLGWSNTEKISLLQKDLAVEEASVTDLQRKLAKTDAEITRTDLRKSSCEKLSFFASFEEIDWKSIVSRFDALHAEQEALERSSDQLARLKESLLQIRAELRRLGEVRDGLVRRTGSLETERTQRAEQRKTAVTNLAALDPSTRARFFPQVSAFVAEAGLDSSPDLASIDKGWQETVKRRMESRREGQLRKEREIRSSFEKRAHDYVSRFPESSTELSASVQSIGDFAALLRRIEQDDLPAYEERFRRLLRESTLNDIALFQQQLENDAAEIHASVEEINRSLRKIEYNQGTFITLSADRKEDLEIRDFRADLRRCLENTMVDEDLYSESKFLQVKKLLDRFASGESVDQAWGQRVTDARSWYTFTASERYMEDNAEKEFYSSSSGKSGGQKEKLAYTILASALSHQYGVGRKRGAGGFRLVMIDEAFGRGSEESTRYGLELFEKLDLQLLIVTPLTKLSVIESHVATVHFISNVDGSASEVRNFTIEEYRAEKEAHLAREAARA